MWVFFFLKMCKISYFFHFAHLCAYWWDALKCVNFSFFFFFFFFFFVFTRPGTDLMLNEIHFIFCSSLFFNCSPNSISATPQDLHYQNSKTSSSCTTNKSKTHMTLTKSISISFLIMEGDWDLYVWDWEIILKYETWAGLGFGAQSH